MSSLEFVLIPITEAAHFMFRLESLRFDAEAPIGESALQNVRPGQMQCREGLLASNIDEDREGESGDLGHWMGWIPPCERS